MMSTAEELPFAKQPIIDRATGKILGCSGAAHFEIDGEPALEFGYRLCSSARGIGLATEAGQAFIDLASQCFNDMLYAMIDPANVPSMRVIDKLGFTYQRTINIDDFTSRLYRLDLS